MLGVIMVTCVSFMAVLEHHFGSVNPGECASDWNGFFHDSLIGSLFISELAVI